MKKNAILISVYFLIFVFIYGFYILNPMYTDWCNCAVSAPLTDFARNYYSINDVLSMQPIDITVNHNDFLSYINSKTSLPYTDMNAYPNLSGIVYTDYISLLCLLCKAVVLTVPAFNKLTFINFQYIGIVGAFNFVLQGLLAFLIIKKITKTNYINALLGSLFFVVAPITLDRFPEHFALSSQWLILASFLPFLYCKNWSKKVIFTFWFILGFLELGTHPYFVLTSAFIVVAFSFYTYFKYGEKKLSFCYLPTFIFGAVIAFCLTGGLGNSVSAKTLPYWFNMYSFNLNSFFNPTISQNFFFSSIFPFLNGKFPAYTTGNWEGFSYLGAGIMLPLIAVVPYLLYFLPKKSFQEKYSEFLRKYKVEIIIFSAFFILTLLYSCSCAITFNDFLLLKIRVPQRFAELLSIFKVPARVIWADFFLIYFFVICFLLKKLKPLVATCVLGVLFIIQAVDLSAFFKSYHNLYYTKKVYSSPLKNDGWKVIKQGKKYAFVNDANRDNLYLLQDVYFWVVKNGLKCNSILSSRIPENREEVLKNRLKNPQNDDLFIFLKSQKNDILKNSSLENCYLLDDYIVCTKENNLALKEYKIEVR